MPRILLMNEDNAAQLNGLKKALAERPVPGLAKVIEAFEYTTMQYGERDQAEIIDALWDAYMAQTGPHDGEVVQ